MLITEIEERQLPLFLIEVQRGDDQWTPWTSEPFSTKEEAEGHRLILLEEYKDWPGDRVRVGPYTVEHWREDLINAVLASPQLSQKAVEQLPNDLLLGILKY